MSTHAKLSPSAAERWLGCPASLRMADKVPTPPSSPYAVEGTLAHELAEIEAALYFGHITARQRSSRRSAWSKRAEETGMDQDEAARHVEGYVELLATRSEEHRYSQVLLEQRMPTGLPQSWGTSDAVIVSPEHIEIVDLKYGRGVMVGAEGNPQLRLYALGALDTYGGVLGHTELVRMTVYQPRLYFTDSADMRPDELWGWRGAILPTAEEAFAGSDRFGPSEAACRWCPAAGVCTARAEKLGAIDFATTDTEVLSDAQMAALLDRAPEVKSWVSAVEDAALNAIYSEGRHLPGWKAVLSRGRRTVPDTEAAVDVFREAGVDREKVTAEALLGIGKLERLIRADLGLSKLEDVLGDLVVKHEGKPSLAREDDKRPGISPRSEAAKDFTDE